MRNAGRVVSKTTILFPGLRLSLRPRHERRGRSRPPPRDKLDRGFETRILATVRGMGYVLQLD